jgi:hypothetical protein
LRFSSSVAAVSDRRTCGIVGAQRAPLQQPTICVIEIIAEEDEDHFIDPIITREKSARRLERNLRGLFNRIARTRRS